MSAIHSVQSDSPQALQLSAQNAAAPAATQAAAAAAVKPPAGDTLTLSTAATQAQQGQGPDPAQTASANPTYQPYGR